MSLHLHSLPPGTVFRVLSPKVETPRFSRKPVKNDSIYRKEAESHSVCLANNKDAIFDRSTLVEPIKNSRFAAVGAASAANDSRFASK